MTTTFDGIRAIIVRDFELPPEQLLRDTLLTDIELDSLAITELVFTIEDEFHITAENTIPPFKTLGDIADYVAQLIAARDTKPRATAKSAAVPTIPSDAAAPTPPRSRTKKARSASNGAPASSKRSGGARKANGKTDKHAHGKGRANGATAGETGGASPKRAAKRPARAAPVDDALARKPKGRSGARAR